VNANIYQQKKEQQHDQPEQVMQINKPGIKIK
jgi:hypothetical protein